MYTIIKYVLLVLFSHASHACMDEVNPAHNSIWKSKQNTKSKGVNLGIVEVEAV